MIIQGNVIAADVFRTLKRKIANTGKRILVRVFIVGTQYASEQFVSFKKKKAESVGIVIDIVRLPENITTDLCIESIQKSAKDPNVNAIIVQLPLPLHLHTEKILSYIPINKDVDVLSPKSKIAFEKGVLDILPPVISSIEEILRRERISVRRKRALVIGRGPLVGEPAAIWLAQKGAEVTVADKDTENLSLHTKNAEVIISGGGVPNLITPNMLTDGVILFDAGTNESNGKLSGDANPDCASKCSIFTPVPGGIGPITIAKLLENVVTRYASVQV